MDELYLIAHKVRGEAAFDIAIKLNVEGTPSDPTPWWIIPTSGHRARPYWAQPLDEVDFMNTEHPRHLLNEMPEGHPDHYQRSADRPASKPAAKGGGTTLADLFGPEGDI